MLKIGTNVSITDNSGAKDGRIFTILGGTRHQTAQIGDIVVLSVKFAEPRKMLKKKDVVYGVIVRQKKPFRRVDGSYISFSDNAVVIVNGKGKTAKEPRANRVFGPVPRELSEKGYQKIISLAPEVL
jgi:large subunit ribosomal protein L14